MSSYYKYKNLDTKTRVQKIKENLDSKIEQSNSGKLGSDPGKDPSNPLRQLGITDTFAGVRASNNFVKKKIIGEGTFMEIPIKQIILEMTATKHYETMVPKKLPSNYVSGKKMEEIQNATGVNKPVSNIATDTIKIKTKEIAKAEAAKINQQ